MVEKRIGGGTSLETSDGARWRLPALVGALVLTSGGAAWWFVRDGRAAGPGPAGGAEFAGAVCAAIAANDARAFGALHVLPDDLSVDGKNRWVPFPGGAISDFEPWHARVGESFRRLRASVTGALQCGEVVHVDLPQSPSQREMEQGTVNGATVRVTGRGGADLILGSSIMTQRGRAFAGLRSGAFARWSDEAQVAEPAPTPVAAVDQIRADKVATVEPIPPQAAEAGGATDAELFAQLSEGSFDSSRAVKALVARGQRDAVVKVLFDRLRTGGTFSAQRADEDLRKLGERPDYARSVPMSPETGPQSTDALELAIELDGDRLRVHWRVHYGAELFGTKYEPYFKIELSGGSLSGEGVRKRYTPVPGINQGSEVLATGIKPGRYAASAFLWSTRPDGTQVSDNAASVFFEVR